MIHSLHSCHSPTEGCRVAANVVVPLAQFAQQTLCIMRQLFRTAAKRVCFNLSKPAAKYAPNGPQMIEKLNLNAIKKDHFQKHRSQ